MNNQFMESIRELNYANLNKEQETRLREMEKKFNGEFSTDYYIMVMEKDTK